MAINTISFKYMWPEFDINNNFFTKLLDHFKIEYKVQDTDSKITIWSVFNNGVAGYYPLLELKKSTNTKNIFITGENIRAYSGFDLNITFDRSDEKNIRVPLWLWEVVFGLSPRNGKLFNFTFLQGLDINKNLKLTEHKLKNKNFCCFIASNEVPERNKFVKILSEYKKVDCGGNCLNNLGEKVKNKLIFQSNYKFCIAFENSIYPGYCTEKILEAYISNCIPIYVGDPTVHVDFNEETFINANNFKSMKEFINYIIKVDNDDELFKSYMNKHIYSNYWHDIFNDPDKKFFKDLCNEIIN